MSALLPCVYGSIGRWNPAPARLQPPVDAIWSCSDQIGAPKIGYGLAFCVSGTRGLLGLDAATGAEAWRLETEAGWGSCQLSEGQLLSTPRPGVLAAVDPLTGSQIEAFAVSGLLLDMGVISRGRVISPLRVGTLAAWDRASRDFAWHARSDFTAHLLAAGHDAVCVAENSAYVALDVENGAECWRFDVTALGRYRTIVGGEQPGAISGRPLIAGLTMYGGFTGGTLIALDLTTGATRWQLKVDGPTPHNYSLGSDGDLLFLSDDELMTIDATSGAVRERHRLDWPTGVEEAGSFAPIAVAQEFVWTVDRLARLIAISRADGRVSVCRKLSARVADPLVLADGRLFVPTIDGELRIFGEPRL